MELGIEPRYEQWDGRGSLLAFIVSKNLQRRHLSESQRAMVAAKIIELEAEEITSLQRSLSAVKRWGLEKRADEILSNGSGSWDDRWEQAQLLKVQARREGRRQTLRNLQQIYLARDGDRFKIGVASLPQYRLDSLKAGAPNIELIETFEGGFAEEKELHKLLADISLGGEWFQYSEDAVERVRSFMQIAKFDNLHTAIKDTAKALNVSPHSVRHGRQVLTSGTPELARAVEQDKIGSSRD